MELGVNSDGERALILSPTEFDKARLVVGRLAMGERSAKGNVLRRWRVRRQAAELSGRMANVLVGFDSKPIVISGESNLELVREGARQDLATQYYPHEGPSAFYPNILRDFVEALTKES